MFNKEVSVKKRRFEDGCGVLDLKLSRALPCGENSRAP
jgi:hypothetical protein